MTSLCAVSLVDPTKPQLLLYHEQDLTQRVRRDYCDREFSPHSASSWSAGIPHRLWRSVRFRLLGVARNEVRDVYPAARRWHRARPQHVCTLWPNPDSYRKIRSPLGTETGLSLAGRHVPSRPSRSAPAEAPLANRCLPHSPGRWTSIALSSRELHLQQLCKSLNRRRSLRPCPRQSRDRSLGRCVHRSGRAASGSRSRYSAPGFHTRLCPKRSSRWSYPRRQPAILDVPFSQLFHFARGAALPFGYRNVEPPTVIHGLCLLKCGS